MRTLLTLALPAALLLAVPAHAQMQSQYGASGATGAGSGTVNPAREVEASDIAPTRNLIGKSVVHRHQGGTAGTIRDVVTGDDGRPKLVMETRDTRRNVVLDLSEVRRRGNAIQLMLDPEQVATLLDYQPQSNMGTMGGTMGGGTMGGGMNNRMGTGPMGGGTAR